MDEKLSGKEKWSYGCGDVGNNIVFGMMSSFLLFMLGWAHFDPLHIGPSSILAIREAFYGGSLVFTAMLFLCMCFYDMDKLHPRMVSELNTRSRMDLNPVTFLQGKGG